MKYGPTKEYRMHAKACRNDGESMAINTAIRLLNYCKDHPEEAKINTLMDAIFENEVDMIYPNGGEQKQRAITG